MALKKYNFSAGKRFLNTALQPLSFLYLYGIFIVSMRKAPYSHIAILTAFLVNTFGPWPCAQAQDFRLPAPGVMVHLSPPLEPPILKGIKVHPDNPFRFDFILDTGDSPSLVKEGDRGSLKQEATKLIKYFLASLTIPEKDLWVNLSPYEKDRIIPQSFGLTEMGRDLLAEDYMLKQITASLIYPEDEIGKKFWKRVYAEAQKKFGTTNIPVNTFNKVWIVPEKAVVYENAKAGTAYVVESRLKVMLEEDYLSVSKHADVGVARQPGDMFNKEQRNVSPSTLPNGLGLSAKASQVNNGSTSESVNALGSQIVREIVIPELTKEVNEDKNFAQLRQVYNSLILATWYKKKIKDSILEQVYADKKKVAGVGYDQSIIPVLPTTLPWRGSPSNEGLNVKATQSNESNDVAFIYQSYLQAFKKGVYNYVKEEADPTTQETMPRKYFSGGATFLGTKNIFSEVSNIPSQAILANNRAMVVGINVIEVNQAMTTAEKNRERNLERRRRLQDYALPFDSGGHYNYNSLYHQLKTDPDNSRLRKIYNTMIGFLRVLEDGSSINKSDEDLLNLLDGVATRHYSGIVRKSRFLGINFSKAPFLNPNYKKDKKDRKAKKCVWVDVSPTEVRLEDTNTKITEDVLEGISEGDRVKLRDILRQAQDGYTNKQKLDAFRLTLEWEIVRRRVNEVFGSEYSLNPVAPKPIVEEPKSHPVTGPQVKGPQQLSLILEEAGPTAVGPAQKGPVATGDKPVEKPSKGKRPPQQMPLPFDKAQLVQDQVIKGAQTISLKDFIKNKILVDYWQVTIQDFLDAGLPQEQAELVWGELKDKGYIRKGKLEFLGDEFLEFSRGPSNEFMTPKEAEEALIKAIQKRGVEIPAADTPIDSLEKLLESEILYKALTIRPDEVSGRINRLEHGGQPLNSWEIKDLNRVLIEANCPEAPKRQNYDAIILEKFRELKHDLDLNLRGISDGQNKQIYHIIQQANWSNKITFDFEDSLGLQIKPDASINYEDMEYYLEMMLRELIPNAIQEGKGKNIKISVRGNIISIENDGKIKWKEIKAKCDKYISSESLYVSYNPDGSIKELAHFDTPLLISNEFELVTKENRYKVDELFETPGGKTTLLFNRRGVSFGVGKDIGGQPNIGMGLYIARDYSGKLGGEIRLADDGKETGKVSVEIEFSDVSPFTFKDQAMPTSKKEKRGGIDLTPANMNLQTQNNGGPIQFHIDPAQLQQLQNAPGFVPVIINIQPMTDLRVFLGVPSEDSTGKLAPIHTIQPD